MELLQYTITTRFDSGGQCNVYAIKNEQGMQFVSKTPRTDKQVDLHSIQREITIMERLSQEQTDGVVQCYGTHKIWNWVTQKVEYHMVMEQCPYGNLAQLAQFTKPFGGYQAYIIMKQIMSAINQIHSKNIIHADIKPQNILITYNEQNKQNPECGMLPIEFKISDFGVAVDVSSYPKKAIIIRRVGTIKYMAPEQFMEQPVKGQDHYKYDVFAAGVTLFQLLAQKHPFKTSSYADREQFNKPNFIAEWAANHKWNISTELKDLLQGMLHYDPVERFTVQQVLESKWFIKLSSALNNDTGLAIYMGRLLFDRLHYVNKLTKIRINMNNLRQSIIDQQMPVHCDNIADTAHFMMAE